MNEENSRIFLGGLWLAVVFVGVQHFSGHYCIAFSTLAALIFLKMEIKL